MKINIKKIIYLLLASFTIYIIYEIIKKMLGRSLGFEELVIGLLIANLGFSFSIKDSVNRIESKLSGHLGWHKGKE